MVYILLLVSALNVLAQDNDLTCGRDEINDEIVEFIPLTENCGKTPKDPKTAADFNGGGIYSDFDGEGAVVRGTGYKFLRDQPNSYNTGKICFFQGCRRLAVSKKGIKPNASSKWKVCLNFTSTSVPNKKFPKCPAAIKVEGQFRELMEKLGDSGNCCYEHNDPVPP